MIFKGGSLAAFKLHRKEIVMKVVTNVDRRSQDEYAAK